MTDKGSASGDLEGPGALASLGRLVADRAADSYGHKAKICFFLGAGADIGSGGITFAELQRQAVEEFSKRRLFRISPLKDIEVNFEELFLGLEADDRALLIEWLFRRAQPIQPSDGYKLLVLLAEAGGVDAVVTTNFDLMLESAQSQLGRDVFQIYAPGIARPYLLSHSRFELPKRPYLKLHGDLASRSVTLLTPADLEHADYDDSMLVLLTSILRTHDLVLVGYSGFDRALANIIAKSTRDSSTRVFWCNPRPPTPGSPLYSSVSGRLRIVQLKFEDLMLAIGRPVLERPSLARTEPAYLRCLFDWRIEYCNREYIQLYAERGGKSFVDVFARRPGLEKRLQSFLLPNRPLALVTGPSGFGKTTLGVRLYRTWRSQMNIRILLIRSRALHDHGDVEQHLMEQLGGLGSRAPLSIFQLERWVASNGMRLVLYIDGINEFSSDLSRCVQFFRSILRFCYFLPERDSAIRVIATIRQETWNAMLPHIDDAQLRKTVWLEDPTQESVSTIPCGALSDEEIGDAIERLRSHGFASIDVQHVSQAAFEQLRDPYLLGTLGVATESGLPSVPTAGVYQKVLEARLQRQGSNIDVVTLKDILAGVALRCLGSQQDRFRELDIEPATLRGEVVRAMKDLHVFIPAGDGFLQFDHDRTLEYFLAVGLGSASGPSLETLEHVLQFLRQFRGQGRAIAAASLYFQIAADERFSIIIPGLELLDHGNSQFAVPDNELLFGFAREVLAQMTEQAEPIARDYLEATISAARAGGVGPHQLRTVVQSAASLQTDQAIRLLTRVSHPNARVAQTEANIYATDKLVKQYLLSGCPLIGLLSSEPYATFFGDTSIAPWQRLGRLLGFVSQLGPDNTHPTEYAAIQRTLNNAFQSLLSERPWSGTDATALADHIRQNSDRLLFNATTAGIDGFFDNPGRGEIHHILSNINSGATISQADLRILDPYMTSLSFDVEYHISHALCILSSLNDVRGTLLVLETEFRTFSDDTSPNKIDFFYSILVYLHVLHNLTYDVDRFQWWEEVVLREWSKVLLYRPGLERGESRGFEDPFDRFFEDGFSVVFPYGQLLPSVRRRAARYSDYRKELAKSNAPQLPLYTKYLEEFLQGQRIDEALQVLQSLASVIVAWPREGLLALRPVIGYPEYRIRRATIRILAESFNRHPEETMGFLQTSGAAVSDDDLMEIKIRQDARIGRRQVDEREWGRILHFLLLRPNGRAVLSKCVEVLLQSKNYHESVSGILQVLGLCGAGL